MRSRNNAAPNVLPRLSLRSERGPPPPRAPRSTNFSASTFLASKRSIGPVTSAPKWARTRSIVTSRRSSSYVPSSSAKSVRSLMSPLSPERTPQTSRSGTDPIGPRLRSRDAAVPGPARQGGQSQRMGGLGRNPAAVQERPGAGPSHQAGPGRVAGAPYPVEPLRALYRDGPDPGDQARPAGGVDGGAGRGRR